MWGVSRVLQVAPADYALMGTAEHVFASSCVILFEVQEAMN
jgi:hypothetical protein